jgi:hypothetical protein
MAGKQPKERNMNAVNKVYSWRDGYSCTVAPDEAGQELERIKAKHGDVDIAGSIVRESRPKSAPLHGVFTWNDSECGERWRRYEANLLNTALRCSFVEAKVKHKEPSITVQVNHRFVDDDGVTHSITIDEVAQNDVALQQITGELAAKIRLANKAYNTFVGAVSTLSGKGVKRGLRGPLAKIGESLEMATQQVDEVQKRQAKKRRKAKV